MSFGGGSGGGGSIAGSTDVALSSPTNGQVLTYDTTLGKWKNAASSGGTVTVQNLPISVPVVVNESGGSYPNRPAYGGAIWWMGPDQPTGGGTTAGGAGAVDGLDVWFKTVS